LRVVSERAAKTAATTKEAFKKIPDTPEGVDPWTGTTDSPPQEVDFAGESTESLEGVRTAVYASDATAQMVEVC